MKKFYVALTLIIQCWFLNSCYKDKGNYDYHDINIVSINDLDTLNGYTAYFGDTLSIVPTISGTLDPDARTHTYQYEWSFHYELADTVISTEKDLTLKINYPPGNYILQYKVTDNSTGVLFHARTNLLIMTEVYEGYLVLNDVDNKSRLDMLSYVNESKQFIPYNDVLAKMGSTLPEQQRPYKILSMNYTQIQDYGIFLLSASGTNLLDPETFGYVPSGNIRNLMIGDVPENFAAQDLTGELTYGFFPSFYMYADNNIYFYSAMRGSAFQYTPLNVYNDLIPFKVSPYVATDGNTAVMYNMDKRSFVRMASVSSLSVSDILNYPTGLDLLYMEKNYSNYAYAILKEPSSSKYFLLRFTLNGVPDYFEEITATDFANATHYAISPDLGYLFYSVGGKLYEYDLSLKKSVLMLDKGNSEISYLAFQHFYNRTLKQNYSDWAKLLTVGIYDPSGTSGSNGALEQYAIPTVNGQITLINRWTGFGKIVSIAYRERN